MARNIVQKAELFFQDVSKNYGNNESNTYIFCWRSFEDGIGECEGYFYSLRWNLEWPPKNGLI